MVAISERFKFRQVKSRMSAFLDRFSMTKSIAESAESMRKPGTRLGLTIGVFSDERRMFIKK